MNLKLEGYKRARPDYSETCSCSVKDSWIYFSLPFTDVDANNVYIYVKMKRRERIMLRGRRDRENKSMEVNAIVVVFYLLIGKPVVVGE